mgnify:CR=1 FL=1
MQSLKQLYQIFEAAFPDIVSEAPLVIRASEDSKVGHFKGHKNSVGILQGCGTYHYWAEYQSPEVSSANRVEWQGLKVARRDGQKMNGTIGERRISWPILASGVLS